MIIHEPQIKNENGEICISSFIEVETDNSLSDTVWFKFPEEYEEFISDSSSGFVVALSFLAMYLGEDIEVRGKMSPKLEYGLKQFQSYFNFWYPDRYKIVNIKCDKFESERSSGSVACSFSGGIDSFSKYKTFPLPLESKNIRNWFVEYYDEVNVSFAKEVMDYAVSLGRKDIARNIKYAIIKPKLIKLSPKRILFRASHKLKKRYAFYYDRFINEIKKQKK